MKRNVDVTSLIMWLPSSSTTSGGAKLIHDGLQEREKSDWSPISHSDLVFFKHRGGIDVNAHDLGMRAEILPSRAAASRHPPRQRPAAPADSHIEKDAAHRLESIASTSASRARDGSGSGARGRSRADTLLVNVAYTSIRATRRSRVQPRRRRRACRRAISSRSSWPTCSPREAGTCAH